MLDLDEMIKKIKSLEIQGAKEIAIESLKFLRNYSKENGFGKKFDYASKRLEDARPTAVVLHNTLEILREKRNLDTISKLLRQLNSATDRIAKNGQRLIKDGFVIMTHCHSGEALSVIKEAKRNGKKVSVIATETEPLHQGIITVKELCKVGIPVTLITDPALGYFMKDVDMVLVGSDAMRKEGNVNKIGTYTMALVAWQNKKPFYVAGNTLKLDKRKKFVIEERPAAEVYRNITGVKIRNPAFDITPWKYVKRVVTEKGVFTVGNILRMLK